MMRVLRLAPYFYFEDQATHEWDLFYEPMGGMQVQIAAQTRAVSLAGCEQVVLTSGLSGVPRSLPWSENVMIHSVMLPLLRIKDQAKGMMGLLLSWALGTLIWTFRQKVQGRARRFDVIHCHCSELPWTYVAAPLVARILDLPLVLTVHCSSLFTSHPGSRLEAMLHPVARAAERRALLRASQVVVLTERMRQCYIDSGLLSPGKVRVIPDGVDVVRFGTSCPESSVEFSREHRLPSGRRIVAFIGRIAPEKGWQTFVDAAEKLSSADMHFLVCGDGHQREAFEAEVARRGLAQHFTFTGFIHHEHVPSAMHLASVVVLPSVHEELGGTILEAFASGTPIVASATGGIPYVIDDGHNGLLFEPGDSSDLAMKIGSVVNDERLANRLAECGRTTAESFDIGIIGADLIDTYGKAMDYRGSAVGTRMR